MRRVSGFEIVCTPNILLDFIFLFVCDRCMVHDILLLALIFQGAIVLVPAVAEGFPMDFGFLLLVYDLVVVGLNDCFHVFGAAVADLDLVPVEDFVQLVLFGEMGVNEGKELLADVGGDGNTEWGVVPRYIAFSAFPFLAFLVGLGVLLAVFQLVLVSALVQCSLVLIFFCFECCFFTRYLR